MLLLGLSLPPHLLSPNQLPRSPASHPCIPCCFLFTPAVPQAAGLSPVCVSPVFPWVLSPNLQASWGPLRAPHQVPPREGSPDLPTHPGRCPWQGHRDEPAPSPEHGRSLGAITNPRRSFQNTHLVPGTSSPEALGKIRGAGPGSLGPAPPADQAPCPQTPALVGGDGRRASPLAWGLIWAPLHVQQRAEPLGV